MNKSRIVCRLQQFGMKVNDEQLLQQYLAVKTNLDLPLKVKLYFSIFQSLIEDGKDKDLIMQQRIIDPLFIKAFSKLSKQEKCLYLYQMIKFIKCRHNSNQTPAEYINNVEAPCQRETTVLKMPYWVHCKFKYDKSKKTINLISTKKNITLSIADYLLRKSSKPNILILQTISKNVSSDNKRFNIAFSQDLFMGMYTLLLKSIIDARNQYLLAIIQQNDQNITKQEEGLDQLQENKQKALVFLNSENMSAYLKFKDQIMQRLSINKFDFKAVYCKQHSFNQHIKIDRSNKIDKLFKMESIINKPQTQAKQQFLANFNAKKYKYLTYSQELQQFSKKYKAMYQKYAINGKSYEQICIKEETNSDKEEVIFMRGVDNILTKTYIEFLIVKIKAVNQMQSKLLIITSIHFTPIITLDIVLAFLIEFKQMIGRKEEKIENQNNSQSGTDDREEFYSVYDAEQKWVEFDEIQEGEKEMGGGRELKSKISTNIECSYLSRRHQITPFQPEGNKKRMNQHYLFKEWVRCKNGGVACINEAIISEQKKLFKKIITMMGKNILKGGGILGVSLPVTIFKRESHLQSIARDFCYSPLLFQRFLTNSDPVQRIKYALIQAISVATLGISMDKPFNPILGETFQGWIDGCPIYLQQISHHPPVGAYLFQGRGYKIYGEVQPKISVGLNCARGYSQRLNFIHFDDNTKIAMSYGKMVIKGMLFGEREFTFQDRIYCYDMKNHYFAQAFYGPRKKGLMSTSTDPDDYIYGKIYRTTSNYLSKFKERVPPIYPDKQYIVKEISSFEGIWNEEIFFDGKPYINFRTDFPCPLQLDAYPLPSNSSYRSDLVNLMEGNIEKAQQQKERLEHMQRRDKKLREGHK